MAFHWSDGAILNDPKMQHRFKVEFYTSEKSLEIPFIMVKSCTVPKQTNNTFTHTVGQHTFNYIGKTTWDKAGVVLVDAGDPDITQILQQLLKLGGYNFPTTDNDLFKYFSKAKSVKMLGAAFIQLNEDGEELGRYVMKNAMLTKVTPTDWSYDSEALQEINIEITYDWAEYKARGGSGVTFD